MNCMRLLTATQRHSIFKIFSVRYVSHHPQKFLEIQDRWREKDNVSKNYELIYKAPMEKILNYATAYLTFSTTTVGAAGLYYFAFEFSMANVDTPVVLGDNVVIANSGIECLSYLGAFVVFHLMVKILLSKYVIRLYQHEDNYIAVFRGYMFNSIKKHKFKLNEFKKLNPTVVVTWGDSRFGLGDKHAILLDNYFKTPEYFNYLLYKKKSGSGPDDHVGVQ